MTPKPILGMMESLTRCVSIEVMDRTVSCGNRHRHLADHFAPTASGADLEIWDRLLEVVEPGEFHRFCVVEDRSVTRFPTETKILAERFGHRWRFPEYPSTQYSMSAYLASRLRELEREGHVDLA